MPTNPDFDWDEVIVSKKPKQKEIDVTFSSDPDIQLGSIEVEDAVERPISSQGLTECGTQKCSAADDYLAALPYDEGIKSYDIYGSGLSVDTPAAIRFRVTNTYNWPNDPIVLDNYLSYNISGRYDLLLTAPHYKAPCENFYDNQFLEATFLNASINGNAAFYPRAFENAGGVELYGGDSLNIRSVCGQYLFGRDAYGGVIGDPAGDAVWNFISLRLQAFGIDSVQGYFTGLNCEEVLVYMNADLRVYQGTTSSAISRLTTDAWNVGNNDSLRVRETQLFPDGPYLQSGDITGAYMFKAEIQIDVAQDGQTATGHCYVECEHVKSGKKSFMKQGFLATGLNGGLKLTDPWSVTQGNDGGMPMTTRYWAGNYGSARTLYFIAYDGWDKENVVRKACLEFERAQPHWQPADYCSRIL